MSKFSRWELAAFILAWLLALSIVCVGAEPAWDATLAPDGQSLVLRPKLPSGVKYRLRVTPGAFSGILATVGLDGFPELQDWVGSITFGTAPIPPTPKPEPPPPTPVSKPVAVYLIYESGDLTPATARVRDGQPWKKSAEVAGIRWLCFDKDQGAKKFPQATARAVASGLPAVVFLDSQGVPDVSKAPATPEAMDALVKQKGGAK